TRWNGTTSPSIGHGAAKTSRDYCLCGYGVGYTPNNNTAEPHLFNYKTDCVLAYDLETEFVSKGEYNMKSPILCSSLTPRTCGWSLFITRTKVRDSRANQIVVNTSEEIGIATIRAIITHTPTFSMGHNIYSFDNTVLAFALPKDHAYTRFFKTVSKSSNNTAPNIGLILNIPGVNNLDTLTYIKASMFGTFSQFSLDNLAKELKLVTLKGSTTEMQFDMEWFTEAANNTRLMCKYNLIDCYVVLELCKKLNLVNEITGLCYCSSACSGTQDPYVLEFDKECINIGDITLSRYKEMLKCIP
ncbi:hypothetical protein ACHAXR_001174, partial [Thalassiosira sp. AJA248-18]